MESCEERIALSASSLFSSGIFQAFTRNVGARDNTTATATDLGNLSGRKTASGYVGFSDQRDVYRFELTHSGDVSLDLDDLTSDADLYLLDGSRSVIARSDAGGSLSESIQTELDAGEYFVIVQRYQSWNSTNYTLDLNANLDVAPDGAGNTFSTAANIGELAGLRSFNGTVGVGDDVADLLRFSVDTTSRVVFELTGLSQDLDLFLFAGHQSPLARATAASNANERIEAWISPGEYYLGVLPSGQTASDYQLSINNLTTSPTPSPTPTPPETPAPEQPTVPTPTPQPDPPTPPLSVPEVLEDVDYFGARRDWGVNDVRGPEAWSVGYAGAGITVAVIDSGVQINHPDLVDSIWTNSDEILGDGIDNDGNGYIDDRYGWDFIGNDNNPDDGNRHGTHVAGIIAAANNGSGATGVAHAATIMPIRVLGDDGSGSSRAVARGIRYAVDNGADVINLSLGGASGSVIYSALRYARANDVFIVAASGNESSGTPGYPARYSDRLNNVLSVGAYDRSRRAASFSNAVGDSRAVQVDAPGVSVYSTVPSNRYAYLSGTSMATPYVAGVAALTLSANPNLTSSQLREVLTQSAITSATNSDSIGAVNAARAIPLAIGLT